MLLVFVRYIYEEDIHEGMLRALLLPKSTTASELFKSQNDYFAEKLIWSFYVGVCTDGAAVMIGRLPGLTVRIKEVAPECEATYCVIHRKMLASRKILPELNSAFDDIVKIINLIKLCLNYVNHRKGFYWRKI